MLAGSEIGVVASVAFANVRMLRRPSNTLDRVGFGFVARLETRAATGRRDLDSMALCVDDETPRY